MLYSVVVPLILDNCDDALQTSNVSQLDSACTGSQSDVSQAVCHTELEVFNFGVDKKLELPDSGKKKKVLSSSFSKFFSRGKERRLDEVTPAVRGTVKQSCRDRSCVDLSLRYNLLNFPLFS